MMIIRRLRTPAAVALLATALTAPARAGYNFTVFDGPAPNGGGTTVNALNNNGAAVGFSTGAGGNPLTNFIRNPDGTFTTLNVRNDPAAMANGINDANQVVGVSGIDAFSLGNNLLLLPKVNANTTSMVALGVNGNGAIVGQFVDGATMTTPGFLYVNGAFTTLNPTATATVTNAQGVNANGLVTGFYSADGVHQHGFFYDSKTNAFALIADPVVNDLLLTQFLGINNKGEAVGYYQTQADNSQHGFLYDIAKSTYTFLDAAGAAKVGQSITQITGINDSAEISGFFVDANGLQRGFVATPAPEPGSMALLCLGVSGAAGYLLRRKVSVA